MHRDKVGHSAKGYVAVDLVIELLSIPTTHEELRKDENTHRFPYWYRNTKSIFLPVSIPFASLWTCTVFVSRVAVILVDVGVITRLLGRTEAV